MLLYHGALAASGRSKVVIAFASHSTRVAPLWAAEAQGFFLKHGIDPEIVFISGSVLLNATLASGDSHVGYTGGSTVLGAAAGGADLKIIASFTNRVTYDLIARPGIKTPKDLINKRFGVSSMSGSVWMGAILGMEHLGLEPLNRDKINFMVVPGGDSLRALALLAGTIDATVFDSVHSRPLQQKGFPVLAELEKYNLPILAAGIVTRNSFIQQNPTTIENVLKAILEGAAFVLNPANKATTLPLLRRRLKINEHAAEEGYRDMVIGLERNPYPSVEGMRNIQRLTTLRNPKLQNVRVEDLIDDRILRKLHDSGFIARLYSAHEKK